MKTVHTSGIHIRFFSLFHDTDYVSWTKPRVLVAMKVFSVSFSGIEHRKLKWRVLLCVCDYA